MQHRYEPTKKTCQNSIFASRFGGEYFMIQCSCGLMGVGKTPSAAMDHINALHERHQPTLLFFNMAYMDLKKYEIENEYI